MNSVFPAFMSDLELGTADPDSFAMSMIPQRPRKVSLTSLVIGTGLLAAITVPLYMADRAQQRYEARQLAALVTRPDTVMQEHFGTSYRCVRSVEGTALVVRCPMRDSAYTRP
jgi:hypothetical protein